MSTMPPPTATPVARPAPTGVWRPPPMPPRRHRTSRWLLGVLVLAVAAVILGSLLWTGVLPGLHNPSTAGSPNGFASARDQAQSAADGYGGGNWSLISVTAIIPSQTISTPLNSSILSGALLTSGCSYTALAAGTETVAGSSNVSQGAAAAWFFLFRNSTNEVLFVSETPEAVTLVGTISGPCTSLLGFLNTIPSSVVEPSVAARAADAGGGYAFLRTHPGANATLSLIGGATVFGASSPAFWVVGYTACPLPGASTNVTASAFAANVSAASGGLIAAREYSQTCPISTSGNGAVSLSSSLELGQVVESQQAGAHVYATSIISAVPPLEAKDLATSVQTSTGQAVPLPAGSFLNLTGPGGSLLASYAMNSGTWLSGSATVLSSGQTLTLGTTISLGSQKFVLIFSGQPPYLGNVIAGIA
ncbi:MAG: hypothetical protein L3K17_08145 [Thermoplasmata archaeon]|nr:hypothetical protein [Thermoplasmata archaeon]